MKPLLSRYSPSKTIDCFIQGTCATDNEDDNAFLSLSNVK